MHQTQFSQKIPYVGFSQIRSQISYNRICSILIFVYIRYMYNAVIHQYEYVHQVKLPDDIHVVEVKSVWVRVCFSHVSVQCTLLVAFLVSNPHTSSFKHQN